MQETRTYQERSHDFMANARKELEAGDLEQASEKAWGAAATILKAVADVRGLEHDKHGHLYGVVRVLVRASKDRDMWRLFHVASDLHTNFYENRFEADEIAGDIEDVERFVRKVERFL